jgi:hypothetical protein
MVVFISEFLLLRTEPVGINTIQNKLSSQISGI